MYFLIIIANKFQTFIFIYVECCVRTTNEGTKGRPRKIKNRKNVNNNELIICSSRVVLEVDEKGNFFYETMMDAIEIIYIHSFHLIVLFIV